MSQLVLATSWQNKVIAWFWVYLVFYWFSESKKLQVKLEQT